MPSWDDYRYFLAVAREGSLSAAARALGVTQPTVGRRIEQLETSLRHALFDRHPSGFELSRAGLRVLQYAEQMERDALGLEAALAGDHADERALVRITTTPSLAVSWLSGRLVELDRQRPDLRLAVQVGIGLVDVRHHHADIALRLGTPGEETLFGRRVASARCGLYASRAYLDRHGIPNSVEELARHVIIESEGEIEHLCQATRLRELAHGATVGFAADNTQVQLAAAREGAGIATLMCIAADAHPDLIRVLPDEFDIELPLWLLINRELRHSPAVRSVFDHLAREAQTGAEAFAGHVVARNEASAMALHAEATARPH